MTLKSDSFKPHSCCNGSCHEVHRAHDTTHPNASSLFHTKPRFKERRFRARTCDLQLSAGELKALEVFIGVRDVCVKREFGGLQECGTVTARVVLSLALLDQILLGQHGLRCFAFLAFLAALSSCLAFPAALASLLLGRCSGARRWALISTLILCPVLCLLKRFGSSL